MPVSLEWKNKVEPESIAVNLKLGPITVSKTWKPHDKEREAAWEMYVELVTRISVQELHKDEGLLREALTSLHSLFQTTRDILREYGPIIGRPKETGDTCFGFIALSVLNQSLRPLLAKWHPLLQDYEDTRGAAMSRVEHERKWDLNEDLRKAMNEIRVILGNYASLLAEAAEVPSIHKIQEKKEGDPSREGGFPE